MAGIFTNLYAFVFIFYTSLQFYQSVFFCKKKQENVMGDYILRKMSVFYPNNLRFLCYDKHHRTKRGKTR